MKKRYINDIVEWGKNSEEEVKGWLVGKRNNKDYLFLDIRDSTGTIQVIIDKDKFTPNKIAEIQSIQLESAISLMGNYQLSDRGQPEIIVSSIKVEGNASLRISPRPNSPTFDPFDPKHSAQLTKHPSFYLRNPKLAAAFKVKSRFRHNLGQWFWDHGYTQFEPPTITTQTLYDDKGVFWINLNGQQVSLSRCATFHLEPSLMAYEKVFCITDSHANEMSRSDRHLAEYTHLKVELAWVNLDDLIDIAGKMFYEVAKKTVDDCSREIETLKLENHINQTIYQLNPANHTMITYDEAVAYIQSQGKEFEYGKSLSTSDERELTKANNESFVWIKYVPCSAEGFPFKRKKDAPHLTMTCDLIAPNGYAEILGTAEKIVDYKELLERMAEKGKDTPEQLERYKDYLDLRKYGLPEHGGIGMGIERAVRYLLDLKHVKFTRPFPVLHGTRVNF